MFAIKNPQDFGAAALFIAFGAAGLWFGREYEVGIASDMGPGYLPMVLSWGLIIFGIIVGLRALNTPGPRIEPVVWRAVGFTLGAIAAYAYLIEQAGLASAVFAVIVLSALASSESRWKETLAMGVSMAAFCVMVFIYALRQSLTVFGAG
jgi:hypothetical protein